MFSDWSDFRRQALLMTVVALVIVFVLWNIPQLSIVLFPFRLFVTFVHETGHGLAAILSGGQFIGFQIFPNGSGLATTAGGSRALILPAGYLGAALFGAVLFYLTNTVPYTRAISITVGLLTVAIAVIFGNILSITTIFGSVMGLLFIAIGLRGSQAVNILMLNVLAMLTGLNAVLDVFYLVNNSGAAIGVVRNDAAAFSADIFPLIPPSVWALIWSVIAILMLTLAVYFSVLHPLRSPRELTDARAPRRRPGSDDDYSNIDWSQFR